MCSPTGVSARFSNNSDYNMLIRNFFDCVDKKSLYYTIPDRIFQILHRKSDFDIEKKNKYLEVIEKLRQAKKAECRLPWDETAEFKKNKEYKLAIETEIIELIKNILGDVGLKEVMKIEPNPRIIYASAKPYKVQQAPINQIE